MTRTSLSTRFTQQFQCRIPILGAPMAGVSGGALAAATDLAGGLGFVAGGHLDQVESLNREIDLFRNLSPQGKLCLGFIGYSSMAQGNTDRVRHVIEQHNPFAVQFFAPAVVGDNVQMAKDLGCLVVAQVGSLQHAQEALDAGVDCLVAQGREAGGHGLQPDLATSTFPLASSIRNLLECLDTSTRPSLLAAGGIADGKGLAAALALGCDGAVFGTRLYASHEAMGHPSFKQRLVDANVSDVLRTRSFDTIMNSGSKVPWPEPFDSVGCVQNQTTKKWHSLPVEQLQKALQQDKSILQSVKSANQEGDVSVGLVHAGESVAGIHSIESATSILHRAEQEALHALNSI